MWPFPHQGGIPQGDKTGRDTDFVIYGGCWHGQACTNCPLQGRRLSSPVSLALLDPAGKTEVSCIQTLPTFQLEKNDFSDEIQGVVVSSKFLSVVTCLGMDFNH